MGIKTLLQQNLPVLNWRCWLMQVVLYNGCKMVVVVVVLIYTTGYHQDYRLLLYILIALLTDNANFFKLQHKL